MPFNTNFAVNFLYFCMATTYAQLFNAHMLYPVASRYKKFL
jgi:hypothetical protein